LVDPTAGNRYDYPRGRALSAVMRQSLVVTIDAMVDHAARLVTTRCHGRVTFADIERHLRFAATERGHIYPELFDARRCTTDITSGQVRTILIQVRALGRDAPFGPTALMSDTDVVSGMIAPRPLPLARSYVCAASVSPAPDAGFRADANDARRAARIADAANARHPRTCRGGPTPRRAGWQRAKPAW